MNTGIKKHIANYFFKKELSKLNRDKVVCNIDKAKSIAILYNAIDEPTQESVNKFVRLFQEKQKMVKAIGFAPYKNLPHYCFQRLSFDYLTKRDLYWYNKPKINKKITDFIDEEFDILIDLSQNDCFPLKYIAGLSKAKFKVGQFKDNHYNIYDFMLNVEKDIEIDTYIKELIKYLSILNKE